MGVERDGDQRPFDEALLDTRTPAEFAVAPDGRTLAFALLATVDDVGRHFPSDIWLGGVGQPARRLTEGHAPAWSPDGSRLAFLSDRITPGHQLPYVRWRRGGEPRLAATLHGSAESVAWSADGSRLLVLAADPGSYALDWSARAVTGADGVAPRVRRPRDAWRRLFMVDPASGVAEEVGPPGQSVWEVDWDGDATRWSAWSPTIRRGMAGTAPDSPPSIPAPGRLGSCTEGRGRSKASSSPRILGTWRSSRATRATPACSSAASPSSISRTAPRADPWPGLETVGRVAWADDDRLWYARYAGTGTAIGELWLDGRREERWEGDAFIGPDLTKPSCDVAGRRHGHLEPPGARRAAGTGDASTPPRATGRDRPISTTRSSRAPVPRCAAGALDGARWRRDRGAPDHAGTAASGPGR